MGNGSYPRRDLKLRQNFKIQIFLNFDFLNFCLRFESAQFPATQVNLSVMSKLHHMTTAIKGFNENVLKRF